MRYLNTHPTVENPVAAAVPAAPAAPVAVPVEAAAMATAAVAIAPTATAPVTATATTLVVTFGFTDSCRARTFVELFVSSSTFTFATGKKRNRCGLVFVC